MSVRVVKGAFDPWQAVQAHQAGLAGGGFGATAVFVGSMRDFNQGESVHSMFLEHYPGMTERSLEALRARALADWNLVDALILHRVGEIRPSDPIVLVAVWSAHRKDAFEASRWIMEELKSRAPFWKKERLPGGERWVEHNTPG